MNKQDQGVDLYVTLQKAKDLFYVNEGLKDMQNSMKLSMSSEEMQQLSIQLHCFRVLKENILNGNYYN